MAWPGLSPDSNQIDFYFRGEINNIVYIAPIENEVRLLERIHNFYIVRNIPSIFERVEEKYEKKNASMYFDEGVGDTEHYLIFLTNAIQL